MRAQSFLPVVVGGILAAVVVTAVYWPARTNAFVTDDWVVVVELAERLAAIPWQEALLRPPADYPVLFRPVPMLTFLLQLWAGQTGPEPFHVVNLVIHAANVLLLTLLAWHVLDGQAPRPALRLVTAVWCGLIYGLHPVLTEPVIWISARPDLLMTFALCLALLVDRLLPADGTSRVLGVAVCFFAAMLCKETAVGFVAALPLLHLALLGAPAPLGLRPLVKSLAPHYRVYTALLMAFFLYLAARSAVSGPALGLHEMQSPARYIASFGQHVLVVVASMTQQIWAAVWPFQNIEPSRQIPLPIDAMAIMPVAALCAGIVALALRGAWRGGAGRVPACLFLAFVAALIPVANIVPIPAVSVPVEVAVASRYLTFPLIFACLAVPFVVLLADTLLATQPAYRRVFLWIIVLLWLPASVAYVRITIPLWKDDVTVLTWALARAPTYWRYGRLGGHYLLTGDLPRAREALATAVKLRDDELSAPFWLGLGVVEARLGNSAQALLALRRAAVLAPENTRARFHLALVQRSSGDSAAAVKTLEEALSRIRTSGRPDMPVGQLHYELGLAYADVGRAGEAIAQLNAALARARGPVERKTFEGALKQISPSR